VMRIWSRHKVMAGRVAAVLAVGGLGVYFWVAGVSRAAAVAGPVAAVIALAALAAPYLLPAYERRELPGKSAKAEPTALAGLSSTPVVIIADHGSAAAQHIDQVTINGHRDTGAEPAGTMQ